MSEEDNDRGSEEKTRKRPRKENSSQRKDHTLMGRMHHKWSIVSKPEGSNATANDIAGVRNPLGVFQPDEPGEYVLQFSTKGHGTTYVETIKIFVEDQSVDPPGENLPEGWDGFVIRRYFPQSDASG